MNPKRRQVKKGTNHAEYIDCLIKDLSVLSRYVSGKRTEAIK